MNKGELFTKICEEHDTYLMKMNDIIAALGRNDHVKDQDLIDRLAFHVIEEIIELRRTYPHKFWKQASEEIDREAMLEETADIFLMFRSMQKEICKVLDVTEEELLEHVLAKTKKNQDRLNSGY
jgi:predicted lipid-binding transport protein (Tim44 family)